MIHAVDSAPASLDVKPVELPVLDYDSIRFEPMYNFVLIRPLDKGAYKEGRIFIPQNSTIVRNGAKYGEVVKVGEGRIMNDGTIKPLKVRPGMEVYYVALAGAEIRLGSETFIITREEELLGIC